jgi:hypothetical protein
MKDWLGRRVLTASRRSWVDLDPAAAAADHAGAGGRRSTLIRLLAR